MQLDDAMYNRHISPGYFEYADIASLQRLISRHVKEEKIAAVERRLHAAADREFAFGG